jgi:hypothetical protein
MDGGDAGPAPWDVAPYAPDGGARSSDATPEPVGDIISRSVFKAIQSANPADQKARLVRLIERTVCDPNMDESIARRAAELVVTGEVDHGNLVAVLVGIEDMRTRGIAFEKGAGAVFLSKVRKWSAWREPGKK